MSRIGRMPVPIRAGVEMRVDGDLVKVKGPKGALEQGLAPFVRVEITDGQALVLREADHKRAKAAHGLMRSLIANMVTGVTDGFSKTLDIIGVGYRAEVSGGTVKLSVGYSHPVLLTIPQGLEVVAESQTRLVVRGADKQQVGQFASDIRKVRPPEPYKGKGIRYANEHIRRKVGKSGVGG
ncbi:MAG: 50S ribosomal protein L6 [Myxococcales bacterium]|nr:50S ribosomal protein L6 [Myxococcales bacterium]MCZ6713823.1 50S ribosomal protein L6 [Deltaproteobacteria bacterium]TDJ02636.1 MAG: 50S ribosomal protein L6 [Deltaproteobacteria bacterium]TDJ07019.1 MAG: 50S ribosomal protein L6 [Deltaproteobacteria bacterium]